MNVQYFYDCEETPRCKVWLKSDEITDGDSTGTYTIDDEALAAKMATGSEIIVMDKPGTILYFDSETQLAYDWTTPTEGEG